MNTPIYEFLADLAELHDCLEELYLECGVRLLVTCEDVDPEEWALEDTTN